MKRGRPAQCAERNQRVYFKKISDEQNGERDGREKIRRERYPNVAGRSHSDLANFAARVRADANADRNFQKKQTDNQVRQFVFERFEVIPNAREKTFGDEQTGNENNRAEKKSQPARIRKRDVRDYKKRLPAETVKQKRNGKQKNYKQNAGDDFQISLFAERGVFECTETETLLFADVFGNRAVQIFVPI